MQAELVFEEKVRSWLQNSRRSITTREIDELNAAIGTDLGLMREENQDRAILARFRFADRLREDFIVAILCDGIGGSANGRASAEIAVATIITSMLSGTAKTSSEQLRDATLKANAAVHSLFGGNGGTTLVMLMITPRNRVAASVGDSRLYSIVHGRFSQITTDDTIAGEVQRLNGSAMPRASMDALSTSLIQFVGMGEGIEPRMYELTEQPNDWFLLTSDGAHRIFGTLVASIFANTPSKSQFLNRLLSLARWTGGSDNASVICIPSKAISAIPECASMPTVELWDAGGKIEIATLTQQPSAASTVPSFAPPILKYTKQKKNQHKTLEQLTEAPLKSGKPLSSKVNLHERLPQRTLQIELSDTPISSVSTAPNTLSSDPENLQGIIKGNLDSHREDQVERPADLTSVEKEPDLPVFGSGSVVKADSSGSPAEASNPEPAPDASKAVEVVEK